MKKLTLLAIAAISLLLILQKASLAQNTNDYLITSDIGSYRKITSGGPTGSILAGADHFGIDHSDTALGIAYVNDAQKIWIDVQVTQHAGVDSDKWLLHEIEDSYRDSDNLNATIDEGVQIRSIDGNNIIFMSLYGGKSYIWLNSNNRVVNIQCSSCSNKKPEPLEVVQAYLAKYPSTITMTDAELKGSAHNVQWLKDEMERRLWLCDKWSMQLQLGKVSQTDMLQALVKNMTIFLNYRQKYFGVSATDDIAAINTYLFNNDGTSIKSKLTDYKTWWTKNKGKRISL